MDPIKLWQKFWNDKDAKTFDERTMKSGRIKAIYRVAQMAKFYLDQEEVVNVDLGCGTGLLAKALETNNVIGVDFSSPLIRTARKRMKTVLERNIFDLSFDKNSIDNVFTLFVMDDYKYERKYNFFQKILSQLKPDGHLFLAAYSKNDERMGKQLEEINKKKQTKFEVYLESLATYQHILQEIGFNVEESETLNVEGLYDLESEMLNIKREFLVISARKPAGTEVTM